MNDIYKSVSLLRGLLAGTLMLSMSNISAQQNKPATSPALPSPSVTVAATPPAYISGSPVYYQKVKTAKAPFTDVSEFNSQDYRFLTESSKLFDGLGRPIQTIVRQMTPGASPKDIVVPEIYNNLGLQPLNYMPYVSSENNGAVKSNPFNDQNIFLSGAYPGEEVFYSKTKYESSPLHRATNQYAQGNSWAGSDRGKEIRREFNTSADKVPIWFVEITGWYEEDNAYSNGEYAAGELTKTILIGEDGNATVLFYDKEGKLLLKKVQSKALSIAGDYSNYTDFLCTFYVYNDLGQLWYIVPPKAGVKTISGGATYWSARYDISFLYEYDDAGRLIAKKSPDADWIYMVYDNRDRLVFMQDGVQRLSKKWSAILYDDLNRQLMTGIITYPVGPITGGQQDMEALAAYVSSHTGSGTNSSFSVSHSGAVSTSTEVTVNTLQSNQKTYQATASITFTPGFDSDNSTNLVAEITSNSPVSYSETVLLNDDPLPPGNDLVVLSINYYDGYDFKDKNNIPFAYSATNNTKLDAANNLNAIELPNSSEQSKVFVRGDVTGSRVRVLSDPSNPASGAWLTAAKFYDENGNIIQAQTENYKGGLDVATYRFNFSGATISSYLVHNNPANVETALQTIAVKTNILYDHAGRVLEVRKIINDDDETERVIVRNKYNALGQLEEQKMGGKKGTHATDPDAIYAYLISYDEDQLESLKYDYNIRGWLKGINKDYANGTGTNWFGMEISFDWGFSKNQFNGNVSGVKWRSGGDNVQRAYGYEYDRVNRLQFADFSQGNGSTYADDTYINFDMQIGTLNGSSWENSYDENGNIKKLKQWGLKLNSSSVVDDLTYNYYDNSNRLKNVIDASNESGTLLGDFRSSQTYMTALGNVKTIAAVDYDYDANGNLKKDRNKDIEDISVDGIQYNHLDLPWKVKVKNKGTITYVYDATGKKLEKITEDNTVSTSGQPNRSKSTVYLNGFQYENGELKFFPHEAGKVRVTRVAGAANVFNYDFTIKDNLDNVRVILTDEKKQDTYPAATLETGATGIEKNYYAIDDANIKDKPMSFNTNPDYPYKNNNAVFPNVVPVNPNPTSDVNANSQKVYRLNGSSTSSRTGLGITLKVMTGDVVDVYGKSFYEAGAFNNNNYISSVLASFINAMAGTSAIAGSGKGATGTALLGSDVTRDGLTDWLNDVPDPVTKPKAYINWILLDEQFRVINSGSGFDPVDDNAGKIKSHHQTVSIASSGYLYVYCSNESNKDVLFDNLQLVHTRGPLLETDEYYPFGLLAAGISYKASGSMENNIKLSSNELQAGEFAEGTGLEFYDFNARMYDQQIGRFLAQEPLVDLMPNWSPYTFAFDNPINYIDPSGNYPEEYEDGPGPEDDDHVWDESRSISLDNIVLYPEKQKEEEYHDVFDDIADWFTSDKAQDVYDGFIRGANSTWEGVKYSFTPKGYLENMANLFTAGGYSMRDNVKAVTTVVKAMPNLTAKDIRGGAGVLAEKVLEVIIIKRVSTVIRISPVIEQPKILFRGGDNFKMSGADLNTTKKGIMGTRGVSTNTNKFDPNVARRGAWQIDLKTIPKDLKINHTNGTHFEIVPINAGMSVENYQKLVNTIKLIEFNTYP